MKIQVVLVTGALTGITASFMEVCMSATAHSEEEHRVEQVRAFLNGFPNHSADQLAAFIEGSYVEHAPDLSDGLAG